MEVIKYKKELVKNISANDIALLIGCGISVSYPTRLPLGKELTDYILIKSLGNKTFDFLIDKWNKINQIIRNESGVNVPLMRLELILNCVNHVDEEFGSERVLQGFYSFVKVNPNRNHFYLSKLLKDGAEIITANFDCAIENALKIKYTIKKEMGIDTTISKFGKIYHFHGIGGDDELLGATISNIKSGFSRDFEEFLSELLEKRILICIGYSFSDFLDMNVFLKKQGKERYRKVIFFQHGDNIDIELTVKLKNLFCCFKEILLVYGDTMEFLSDISHLKCNETINDYVVDWKYIFKNIYKNNGNKIFYLLKIFNQSGINISDEMVWLGKNREEIIHKIISKVPQNMKNEKYIGELKDRNKTILSDIVDIANKSEYQRADYSQIHQIYEKLTAKSGVRFEAFNKEYNDILYYFERENFENCNVADQYVYAYIRIVNEQIVNYVCNGRIQQDLTKLQHLWKIGYNLIKLNVKKFTYISFYIDVCRSFTFLSTILKYMDINELKVCEKKQIEMSLEICAMESVVKIYLNSSLNILTYFINDRDEEKLKYAMHKIDIAKRCADLLNDIRIQEKVKIYKNILSQVVDDYNKNKQFDDKLLLKFINR